MNQDLANKRILLIVSGGIAAYKSLELIRLLRKSGAHIRVILTKGGAQFVTPLSIASLTGEEAYTDLWSLKDETEMGHIRLSREADLIVIAPASANLLAKMTHGLAGDLATTTLLAADKSILIAPAMNHKMWDHPATQANIKTLAARGVTQVGPFEGDMACSEYGLGRMAEAQQIFDSIKNFFFDRPLKNLKALVTAGPTFEPLDPVRFLGNRSSGKQGYAIAQALRDYGADVTLVSGPTALPAPAGLHFIKVETAAQMLQACLDALPTDIAVCAAAVADWTPASPQSRKMKKREGQDAPDIKLVKNPDILSTLSTHKNRPHLVIGFAAETENLLENAAEKRVRKKCDWILANDVSSGKTFGSDQNHAYLVTPSGTEDWQQQSKQALAYRLAEKIKGFMNDCHAKPENTKRR